MAQPIYKYSMRVYNFLQISDTNHHSLESLHISTELVPRHFFPSLHRFGERLVL